MNTQLKNVIKLIEPEYSNNNNFMYPLPKEVSLHLDNEEYLIEINLNDGVLYTNIYVGEDEYNVTDEDAEFIHSYLTELLEYQIELTERYYEEQMYYERERYNDFGSFYIR